ncbi:hypothetical protein CL642_01365 [bacterium]|nr:hypothetical protein [bacterium]
MLRHELAHFTLDSIFGIVSQEGNTEDSFSIDIDDCPCPKCEARRADTILPFSTIEVTVNTGGTEITQRLTTDEAREIGRRLIEYAEFLASLNDDLHKEENPLGDLA